MTESITKIIDKPKYWEYAKAINKKVFGKHEKGIRNKASQVDLQKISDMEKFITQSIDLGIIRNENQLMSVINAYRV